MRRDTVFLVLVCTVAVLVSAFISSMFALQDRSALFFLGVDSIIALATLGIVTVANRRRIAPMKAKGGGIDFMIRPIKAIERAVVYLLCVLGVLALFVLAIGDASVLFERKLTGFPILSMGLAIYATAYTEFDR